VYGQTRYTVRTDTRSCTEEDEAAGEPLYHLLDWEADQNVEDVETPSIPRG
jgi:hypothetical protein